MHPLVRAAVAVAVLAAVATVAEERASLTEENSAISASSSTATSLPAPCPPGTLPDDRACIPVPRIGSPGAQPSAGHERWQVHERVALYPNRPADFDVYRLPIPVLPGQHPELASRELEAGGSIELVRFVQAPNELVSAIELDGQRGPAAVLYAGKLDATGSAVITHHRVSSGTRESEYFVVYAGLGQMNVEAKKRVAKGQPIGRVASSGGSAPIGHVGPGGSIAATGGMASATSESTAAFELGVRRLREGQTIDEGRPLDALSALKSITVDVRNVLQRER